MMTIDNKTEDLDSEIPAISNIKSGKYNFTIVDSTVMEWVIA